jgi:hypothetical protein
VTLETGAVLGINALRDYPYIIHTEWPILSIFVTNWNNSQKFQPLRLGRKKPD